MHAEHRHVMAGACLPRTQSYHLLLPLQMNPALGSRQMAPAEGHKKAQIQDLYSDTIAPAVNCSRPQSVGLLGAAAGSGHTAAAVLQCKVS